MGFVLLGFGLGLMASTYFMYYAFRAHCIREGDYDPEGRGPLRDLWLIVRGKEA